MFNKGQQHLQQHQAKKDANHAAGSDVEALINQINQNDDFRSNLKNELMKLNRSLVELNQAEHRMASDLTSVSLSTLGANFDEFDQLLKRWEETTGAVVKNREDLLRSLNRTVIEPLKEFRIAFNEIKSAIRKYEQLSSDVERYKMKVSKYQKVERTSTNIMKLKEYSTRLAESQHNRDDMRARLEKELPTFLKRRLEYFQPSLAAFICAHILHSGNNMDALKDVSQQLGNVSASSQDNRTKLASLFCSMEELSIVTPSTS